MKTPFFIRLSFFLCIVISFSASAQNYNLTFRSQIKTPGKTCAGIWGYVDSLGSEYALVGSEDALLIYNIDNPDTPKYVTKVPLTNCLWHEIQTSGKYAYVTTDCSNAGVVIVNLGNLPGNNISSKVWKPTYSSKTLTSVHTLFIEGKKLYLYGNNIADGYLVADITNQWSPSLVGSFDSPYIHDAYVRNDTVYGSHIYDGTFSIIDASTVKTPVMVASHPTPVGSTHNTALSNDGKFLFATEETDGGYLSSYNIDDINNIEELDKFKCVYNSDNTVHNTMSKDGWLVNACFNDGVDIVDAQRPENLVEVAWYDTHPTINGTGMEGCWGVYPYLPSGNIISSHFFIGNGGDNNEGFFVFTPTYAKACFLEGFVFDSICNIPIAGVTLEILNINKTNIKLSKSTGEFKTGYYLPGTYDIKFSRPGYQNKIVYGVSLLTNQVTTLNVKLNPIASLKANGLCVDKQNIPIDQQLIELVNQNTLIKYQYTTDVNGKFTTDPCSFFQGTYELKVSKWGYLPICKTIQLGPNDTIINIQLQQGYEDDFMHDLGWTINSTQNLTEGFWTRTKKGGLGDVTTDCDEFHYAIRGGADPNQLYYLNDGNYTELVSPSMDLSGYNNPYVNISLYSFMGNSDDSVVFFIDDSSTNYVLENVLSFNGGAWKSKSYKLTGLTQNLSQIRFHVNAINSLKDNGSAFTAYVDKFFISEGPVGIETTNKMLNKVLNAYPNPFTNSTTIKLNPELITSGTNSTLLITDLTGNLVHEYPVSNSTLTIGTDFAAGLYLITLKDQTGNYYAPVKLIKY